MKVTIESTAEIVPFSALPANHARVWRGVTEAGVPVLVLVALLANESDADRAAMEAELATLEERGSDALGVTVRVSKGRPS